MDKKQKTKQKTKPSGQKTNGQKKKNKYGQKTNIYRLISNKSII